MMSIEIVSTYLDKAKKAIYENLPNFPVHTVSFLGEGFDNFAVMVNGEYVFRFSKFPGSNGFGSGMGGGLLVETCLLPKLSGHIQTSIPNFEYIGKNQGDVVFVGYKSVPGEQFSAEQWDNLGKLERANLTLDITTFISQMHMFPIEEAQGCNVNLVDFYKKYQEDRVKFRQMVAPLLDQNTNQKVENMLNRYLSNKDNFSYKPVLLHADLWFSHLFVDPITQRLSGVIDFSDTIIGDPDYDLIQMAMKGGKETLRIMINANANLTTTSIQQLLAKANFFYRINLIQDTIFFIETKNTDGIVHNLEEIQKISKSVGWE